jgi:hypothetical protein
MRDTQRTQNQKTDTRQSHRTAGRSGVAALVVAVLALSALLLGGGAASAKSAVAVTMSTHALRVGQSVRATASGGDDSARYTYLCVDLRAGAGVWQPIGCSKQPFRAEAVSVRVGRRGTEQFRARLLTCLYPGGPLRLDRISNATTVLVH